LLLFKNFKVMKRPACDKFHNKQFINCGDYTCKKFLITQKGITQMGNFCKLAFYKNTSH
jgi:hypothetical protein